MGHGAVTNHAPAYPNLAEAKQLQQQGYTLLRGAIPAHWLTELRNVFDAGLKPADQWPVPRGTDWGHALVDLSPTVQAVCKLPELLAVSGLLIGERFFLAQVEGREPLQGGGQQTLHRDFCAQRPGDTAIAIAFLDDFGAHNGATRIVPGSHRPAPGQPPFEFDNASLATQLSGSAGDILVFDADLVHAGCINPTGARRRSLLITYFAEPLYAAQLATAKLRSVRMHAAWFDPPSEGEKVIV